MSKIDDMIRNNINESLKNVGKRSVKWVQSKKSLKESPDMDSQSPFSDEDYGDEATDIERLIQRHGLAFDKFIVGATDCMDLSQNEEFIGMNIGKEDIRQFLINYLKEIY